LVGYVPSETSRSADKCWILCRKADAKSNRSTNRTAHEAATTSQQRI
jgi:hypothetical protein